MLKINTLFVEIVKDSICISHTEKSDSTNFYLHISPDKKKTRVVRLILKSPKIKTPIIYKSPLINMIDQTKLPERVVAHYDLLSSEQKALIKESVPDSNQYQESVDSFIVHCCFLFVLDKCENDSSNFISNFDSTNEYKILKHYARLYTPIWDDLLGISKIESTSAETEILKRSIETIGNAQVDIIHHETKRKKAELFDAMKETKSSILETRNELEGFREELDRKIEKHIEFINHMERKMNSFVNFENEMLPDIKKKVDNMCKESASQYLDRYSKQIDTMFDASIRKFHEYIMTRERNTKMMLDEQEAKIKQINETVGKTINDSLNSLKLSGEEIFKNIENKTADLANKLREEYFEILNKLNHECDNKDIKFNELDKKINNSLVDTINTVKLTIEDSENKIKKIEDNITVNLLSVKKIQSQTEIQLNNSINSFVEKKSDIIDAFKNANEKSFIDLRTKCDKTEELIIQTAGVLQKLNNLNNELTLEIKRCNESNRLNEKGVLHTLEKIMSLEQMIQHSKSFPMIAEQIFSPSKTSLSTPLKQSALQNRPNLVNHQMTSQMLSQLMAKDNLKPASKISMTQLPITFPSMSLKSEETNQPNPLNQVNSSNRPNSSNQPDSSNQPNLLNQVNSTNPANPVNSTKLSDQIILENAPIHSTQAIPSTDSINQTKASIITLQNLLNGMNQTKTSISSDPVNRKDQIESNSSDDSEEIIIEEK